MKTTIILLIYFTMIPFRVWAQTESNSKLFQYKGISSKIYNKITQDHFKLFDHKPSAKEMDQILSIFYQNGNYESLQIQQEGGVTTLTATLVKSIVSINVRGNAVFSKSEVLSAFSISQGDPFIFQNVYAGAERVKEFYGRRGYFNSIVSIDTQPTSSQNGVHLLLEIDEKFPCIIKDIKFISPFGDLQEQLTNTVKYQLKKPFSDERISNIESDIKDFFTKNRILSGTLMGPNLKYNESRSEVTLSYTLENAYMYSLSFKGNSVFKSTQLSSQLALSQQPQLGSNPSAELAFKLNKFYKDNGFAHVQINYEEKVQKSSFIRSIQFKIKEGPKSYLGNIQFNGKLNQKESYYLNLFKQYYNSSLYTQERLQETQNSIITHLQDNGYLKAKFISSQTHFSKDLKHADISLFLDQGPLTIVKSIHFKGIKSVSKTQLQKVIGLSEEQPLNIKNIELSTQRLVDYYHNSGYLDMQMKSPTSELVKYSRDNTEANLFFEISEGPQVKIAKILIEGNQKTKNYVILNELEFDIGDVLTPQRIQDSEYHIQKTGLFSQVEITTIEKQSSVSERTVLIRVSEKPPGLFNMGLGVNTEFDLTLRGYAGLSYNNIAGTARSLSARAEVKRVSDINFIDHNLTLSYLEPTLFAKRTRGRISYIRSKEILSRSEDIRVLSSNRLNFLLEKDFTRAFKLTWVLWSISSNKEFILNGNTIEKVQIGSLGPVFEYDKRDNPFVTKNGFYLKLASEFADPSLASSKSVHYTKNLAQVNTYIPIRKLNIVWANFIAGGYLKNLEDTNTSYVPDLVAFKLGGRDSIRGFEPNEIPRSTDANGKPVFVYTDSEYYFVKTEFRIPVYGQIESVLFYDGGAVFVKGNTFEDNYRDSAGLGIRYKTPVGPLSIEYGYKLDRNRSLDESAGRLHISFGTF